MTSSARRSEVSVDEVLLPVVGAARRTRDVITDACLQWEMPHLVRPASLVATELVTNAVQHAQTMVDLSVLRGTEDLVIRVGDGSLDIPIPPVAWVIAARCYEPDLGRGLTLVAATADHWGYEHVEGGKMVWAALRHGQR